MQILTPDFSGRSSPPHPHCLSLSLSHLSFRSLSLSLLSVSRLSVSLLSLLSQEDPGEEPHIKDSSPGSVAPLVGRSRITSNLRSLKWKTTDSRSHLRRPLVRVEVHTRWLKLSSSHLPSLLPLRKFDSVLSSLFGMRLALRILRPHSLTLSLTLTLTLILTLTLTLTVSLSLSHLSLSSLSLISLSLSSLSLSHLSLSSLSLISLISPSSLSHLSPLSLSLLCLSSFRLFSLSSLVGGSGQRATYKGLFTWNRLPRPTCARRPAFCYSVRLPPKRAPCFFLPRWPLLSHSGALAFAPPLASSLIDRNIYLMFSLYINNRFIYVDSLNIYIYNIKIKYKSKKIYVYIYLIW